MRGSGAIDANQGVAVATFVVEGQVERSAVPVCRSRPRPPRRAPARREGPPTAAARDAPQAGMGGRGRSDRIAALRCDQGTAARRSARTSASASSAARLAFDRPRSRLRSSSTKVTLCAPRESASRPSAPEPANRSRTRASSVDRPGSRTAPPAPGPTSGGCCRPAGP